MNLLLASILVALVYGLANMDIRMSGATRWYTPISIAAVVGLVTGDMQTGIIMGIELQLIFLGIITIGNVAMPDAAAGTALAIAFVNIGGLNPTSAIALAMPLALLFQPIGNVKLALLNVFTIRADKHSKNANIRGVETSLHLGNITAFLFDFIPMFIAVYIGRAGVQAVVNVIPGILMAGLEKTAEILPALGIAYLMVYVIDKFTLPYLFLGFILSSFLGMDSLGVAFIGLVIALVYFNTKQGSNEKGEVY